MNWQEIWNTIVKFFNDNWWNILSFFITLIVGFIIIKIIMLILKKIMRARKMDEMAIKFIAAVARFCLWLLLVLILLSIIGIPITGITTALSAAVLAIGVALKDFLSNVASGMILIGSHKYKKGDFIRISGEIEGYIVDINFLFTTLKTYDNTQITLPNSTMVNSSIIDVSSYPARRVAITFSVAYESDTKLVRETLLAVMNSCGLVLKDPAPMCRLKTLGESSIDFFCTCYCDSSDYWDTYFYIMDRGFDECKRAGISFAFKQVTISKKQTTALVVEHPEGLPEKVEKLRETKNDDRPLTLSDLEDMSLMEILTSGNKKKHKKSPAKKAETKTKSPAPAKPNPDKK